MQGIARLWALVRPVACERHLLTEASAVAEGVAEDQARSCATGVPDPARDSFGNWTTDRVVMMVASGIATTHTRLTSAYIGLPFVHCEARSGSESVALLRDCRCRMLPVDICGCAVDGSGPDRGPILVQLYQIGGQL